MKNLANCKPSEFLVQTNKIRKSVHKWLTITDILNIRKRAPKIDPDASEEESEAVIRNQVVQNLNDMLDAVLDKHPKETLEVIALACFIDPKDADNHSVSEYLSSVSELLADEAVLSFFTSLARLDARTTFDAPKV